MEIAPSDPDDIVGGFGVEDARASGKGNRLRERL